MAKIPSWFWIGAGGVIIAYSLYVGGKMKIFLYPGLLFLVIGIFKLCIGFVAREKETPAEERVVGPLGKEYRQEYCPRCGKSVSSFDYFCPKCGSRLR